MTQPITVPANLSNLNYLDNTAPNYHPKLEYLKDRFPKLLALIGFLASIFAYYVVPSNFNLAIILLYLFSFLLSKLGNKKRGFGIVFDKATRKVIPLATVDIFNANLGVKIGTTTTDNKGRYYVLLPANNYDVKINIQTSEKSVQTAEKHISKDHSVVDFDIGV